VPEIAARAHLDHIDGLIERALVEAGIGLDRIDGIAAAAGPGLIGGLIVGTMAAKGIAWAARKPFIAVNHLEAHALTARLSDGIDFPYLLSMIPHSFMSRANSIVIHGSKLDLAMQLILTPLILQLMERKRRML